MKQSGHLNPSEQTGTECPVTSKYGRTPPNKHGGVGRQQHVSLFCKGQFKIEQDQFKNTSGPFLIQISNTAKVLYNPAHLM